MPHKADRLLTRLWLAVAAPLALGVSLHLGALFGAGLRPQPVMEPGAGSAVMVCNRRSTHEKLCSFPAEN